MYKYNLDGMLRFNCDKKCLLESKLHCYRKLGSSLHLPRPDFKAVIPKIIKDLMQIVIQK